MADKKKQIVHLYVPLLITCVLLAGCGGEKRLPLPTAVTPTPARPTPVTAYYQPEPPLPKGQGLVPQWRLPVSPAADVWVAWLPAAPHLAVVIPSGVTLYNAAAREIIWQMPLPAVKRSDLQVSPDGRFLVFIETEAPVIQVIDISNQARRQILGEGRIQQLAFSADGRWLAYIEGHTRLHLFNLHSGHIQHRLEAPAGYHINHFAFDTMSTQIAVAAHTRFSRNVPPDLHFQIWDFANDRRQNVPVNEFYRAVAPQVAFTAEHTLLTYYLAGDACHGGRQVMNIWDFSGGTISEVNLIESSPGFTLPLNRPILLASYHNACSVTHVRTLKTLSLTGRELATISLVTPPAEPYPPNWYQFATTLSTDGRTLITTGTYSLEGMGVGHIWEAHTGKLRHALTGNLGRQVTPYLSPGGRLLATANHDGDVYLWDVETAQALAHLDDTWLVYSAALRGDLAATFGDHRVTKEAPFSADGRYLVGRQADGSVQVWQIEP